MGRAAMSVLSKQKGYSLVVFFEESFGLLSDLHALVLENQSDGRKVSRVKPPPSTEHSVSSETLFPHRTLKGDT